MFAWNINSWSVIHRSLFLFKQMFGGQTTTPFMRNERTERYLTWLIAAPYCVNTGTLYLMYYTSLLSKKLEVAFLFTYIQTCQCVICV